MRCAPTMSHCESCPSASLPPSGPPMPTGPSPNLFHVKHTSGLPGEGRISSILFHVKHLLLSANESIRRYFRPVNIVGTYDHPSRLRPSGFENHYSPLGRRDAEAANRHICWREGDVRMVRRTPGSAAKAYFDSQAQNDCRRKNIRTYTPREEQSQQ